MRHLFVGFISLVSKIKRKQEEKTELTARASKLNITFNIEIFFFEHFKNELNISNVQLGFVFKLSPAKLFHRLDKI